MKLVNITTKKKRRSPSSYITELIRNFGATKKMSRILTHVVFVVFFFLISLLVEIFFFNLRHWTTLRNKPFTPDISVGKDLRVDKDGVFEVLGNEHVIIISGLDCKVNTLYLKIININQIGSTRPDAIEVSLDATDYSHYQFSRLGKRELFFPEERSAYMTLHLYGDAKQISLYPYILNEQKYKVSITVNPVVPMFFSWERLLVLFFIMVFIYFFRPSSILHNVRYLKMDMTVRYSMLLVFFVINALILFWVNGLNEFYQGEYGVNTEQYQHLAEAFKEGSLSLLYEPDERLKTMENPYDISYRNSIMDFDDYKFDHALYNGKYYVYFGVVPCVLLYLPYYLITGTHIHNHTVCFIGVVFILLGFLLLYDELIKRYAKKCSVALWFLTSELTVLGSYIVYVTKRPDLYSVPIIWATAFAVCGMWAFIMAMPQKDEALKLNKAFLVLGSVLTALVAGCRPQLFLVVILDIILLREYVFSLSYLKSKEGILSIVSVFTPMILIGGALMTYNALRFGSPFDFGAFYNLTFNDMRFRGVVWDRVPLGAFVYLFHPIEFLPEYPYFGNIMMNNMYLGETIQETTYGGIFFTSPFAVFGLFSFFYRKKMQKQRTLFLLSVFSILIALVIMVFDTINSGILARYFFNFSFLWMIAATFTLWVLLTRKDMDKNTVLKNTLLWILVALVVYGVIYQMFTFMLDSGDYFKGNRSDLFWHYYYLFGFLL